MKIIIEDNCIINFNRALNEDLLYEMANIPKSDTHLPYDIWVDSSGRFRNNKHFEPRIKIHFDDNLIPFLIDKDNSSIPDSVKQQLGFDKIAKQRLIELWVKNHYELLMKHWKGEISDRELLNQLYIEDNKLKK